MGTGLFDFLVRHRRVYLIQTTAAGLIVMSFFALQVVFVIKSFHPNFIIAPIVLAVVVGLLVSTLSAMRIETRRRNQLFRAMIDLAQEFSYFRRSDGRYEYVSPYCEQITGFAASSFYREPDFMTRLIHPDDRKKWLRHLRGIQDHGEPDSLQFRIITRSGEERWINHLCSAVIGDDGKMLGVRSTNLDITQQVESERQLLHLANYDPLTELPNRRLLMDRLIELTGDEAPHARFALLFLDLDHFKHLNDTHGHAFGDELLRVLAARLRRHCREGSLSARFGGDEFVIVVPGVKDANQASAAAGDILSIVEEPFAIEGKRFFITGSIGIAFYPHDSSEPEDLIRSADMAMYRAKQDGRSTVAFYSREMLESSADFLDIETRLRDALEREEVTLHYQPRVRLSDGAIVAVEALARWPVGDSWISPGRFIPVAEESGLIARLTEQLLAQAARQAQQWPGLRISFNLSGRLVRRLDMCRWLHGIVSGNGGRPQQFELEVTEGVLIDAKADAALRMNECKSLGYRFALDDFGTGFSSLSYLRDLPFDVLKLDGSFVRGMGENAKDGAVVDAVATLCRQTGMELVAEGIETEEQLARVRALGVAEGQGYLLSRPLPAARLRDLLSEGVRLAPAVRRVS